MNARMIAVAGPLLIAGIAAIVVVAIAVNYGIGRALRLPHRMALLVACGNSAVAAVAAIIGANGEDVAASIAFTALLGVLVVLGLPFLPALLHLPGLQYGVLAGLTVYAAPQVLATAGVADRSPAVVRAPLSRPPGRSRSPQHRLLRRVPYRCATSC